MLHPDPNIIIIDDEQYLNDIVDLHITSFKNVLIGQLGKPFLLYYYQLIQKNGIIIGYVANNQLLGFISGIENEKQIGGFYYNLLVFWSIIKRFYKLSFIKNILKYIVRIFKTRKVNVHAELLSIVINAEHRKKGIGKKLVYALEKYFLSKNIFQYKVFTDLKYSTGSYLYENMGFTLIKTMNLLGLRTNLYLKQIKK
jgi:GNAT superfamily N-acetyltransferase